jgi:hypothetical protein
VKYGTARGKPNMTIKYEAGKIPFKYKITEENKCNDTLIIF